MPSRKSGGNSRLRKVYRKVFPEYKIIDPAKNGDFAANLAEKKHGIGRTHLLKHTIRDGGGSTALYHFYKPTSPTRPSDLEQAPWKVQGAPGPPSASAVMYYIKCRVSQKKRTFRIFKDILGGPNVLVNFGYLE